MSENTNDYEPYNAIVEPAISDIADSVPLPVKTAAQSYMWNKYMAGSQTTSEIKFDINVNPAFLIKRDVYISGDITVNFKVDKTGGSPGPLLLFGENDSVRPFFFNQLITQATLLLGNNLINLSQRNLFDGLLKCVSKKFLSRWNSQTASYIDNSFKNYKDAPGSLNNPLQGFEDSISSAIYNGAYPVEFVPGSILQYNGDTALQASVPNYNSITTWATGATNVRGKILLKVNEPLFISPMIYNGDWEQNSAALYGINKIGVYLTLSNDAKHMFCRSEALNTVSYSFNSDSFTNFTLNYITMTPQLNQILPLKAVYPIKTIDGNFSSFGQTTVNANSKDNKIMSSPISLGSIPDYFVIYVRKHRNDQTLYDASSAFMPIKRLILSLNNNDRLLATLNPVDLWKLSVKNGSSQSFYEFSGKATVATSSSVIDNGNIVTTVNSSIKNTIGSLIIISATDLNLQAPLAPGTLSNLVLNVQCEYDNNDPNSILPELVVMQISNSIMTIMNGDVKITRSLFYEAGNAAVLSNNSVPIKQDLSYSTRQGGNLSTSIATKLNKSLQGKSSGSGLRSAGNAGNAGSSLFY